MTAKRFSGLTSRRAAERERKRVSHHTIAPIGRVIRSTVPESVPATRNGHTSSAWKSASCSSNLTKGETYKRKVEQPEMDQRLPIPALTYWPPKPPPSSFPAPILSRLFNLSTKHCLPKLAPLKPIHLYPIFRIYISREQWRRLIHHGRRRYTRRRMGRMRSMRSYSGCMRKRIIIPYRRPAG